LPRKGGIPLSTDSPAPVSATTLRARLKTSAARRTSASSASSIWKGVEGSAMGNA
jgi:hypothetical protein